MIDKYSKAYQSGSYLQLAFQPNVESTDLSSSWDDKELFIRKVFEEDPKKGMEILFKRYYNALCSYIIRYVYSKEIAQDIISDLFYSLWKDGLYQNMHMSYRAYLYVAARNRALKYLRKELGKGERENLPEEEKDFISSFPSPQQIIQYEELSLKIEQAIQSLPPQNQKVFLMNRFEGKKYTDISKELNISKKTVEAHISKALTLLRKLLQNDL
jgi:RNA polymerase sigma-70 factor (ECF subfamily)